jgi:tetraacyldisaccharide 4'-kinase
LYAAGLAVKDGLRAAGILGTKKLQWPVVSVGSLSAGGAGKTPVVIALAELLRDRGWAVDVLSRGYGRAGRGVERVDPDAAEAGRRFGDEPVLIARRAGVPVWVGADRFAAGEAGEAERVGASGREADSSASLRNDKQETLRNDKQETLRNDKQETLRNDKQGVLRNEDQPALRNEKQRHVHLLDDGFQHRRLARTLDVVLVTEEDLDDALLPAGNLREGLAALRRADVVVIREEERERVEPRVRELMREGAGTWSIRRQISFPEVAPVLFSDAPTYGHIVFSAIARPANFVHMLKEVGIYALETVTFPDHHAYTANDMRKLVETAELVCANGFVTTEKDVVKLSPEMRAQVEAVGPLVVARLESLFVDESEVVRELEARIS